MNESDTSDIGLAVPATFDSGILLVDETQDNGNNPSEMMQGMFYEAAFGDSTYTSFSIDAAENALERSTSGQYGPIFWVDDDDYAHLLEYSDDSLEWYLGYDTDFFPAGWGTIVAMTGQSSFHSGDFFHDQLGLASVAENILYDFSRPIAENGWPPLEIRDDAYYQAPLPNIDIFTAAAGAEVIYTFDSHTGNPFYGGKPVGIAYDSHHGKRVVLGFPLYYLTESSAQALIAKVFEYFAEETFYYGDVNGDWSVNILDITYLINYLYKDGPSPIDMNNGDPDAGCAVNILDVTYLINYLYKGGPEPLEGCVN